MLHTYETLGWWRKSTANKRIHFAEEYNEYHHLLIMESLGGDQECELIEAHAVDTYAEFVDSNKDLLSQMEAPQIAKDYYESLDMYVFDEFQTNRVKGSRRPVIHSLYDVFCNIRDDEQEHVNTMSACQDPSVIVKSPNTEAAIISYTLAIGLLAFVSNVNIESLLSSSSSVDGSESVLKSIYETIATNIPTTGPVNPDDITSIKDSTESVIDIMLKKVSGLSENVDSNVIDMIAKILSKFKL
eukprot:gene17635-23213_t